MTLLIVGFEQPGQMGSYLRSAADQLGVESICLDANRAQSKSAVVQRLYWRLRDKQPPRIRRFGAEVIQVCADRRPNVVLTTGCAPLDRSHIEVLKKLGSRVVNYSTDDPWNPTQRARWFLAALPVYNAVFTPRHANLEDFRRHGVNHVYYLPFGYDPQIHKPWGTSEVADDPCDILFVGGCDADRLPLISALIDAGMKLALFGGYWDRHPKTRPYWRGIANQDVIRSASAAAQISLCVVRRANRDGHTMRTFESAAIGGCLMVEDTPDHRRFFGPHDHAVRYFATPTEATRQATLLLKDASSRNRLSRQIRETLMHNDHTYANRLSAMLRMPDGQAQA